MGSRLRSLYERRFRHRDDQGSELVLAKGEPVLVVERGRSIGYRKRDGGVWKPPEQPVEEWLESDWGSSEDDDWMPLPVRWRR